MSKPICISCCREMKVERTGVTVAPDYNIYHQQRGDMYVCPICGTQVVVGLSASFHEQKAPDFAFQDQHSKYANG